MDTWNLYEAKNKLSVLIDQALQGKPQRVTRRGKKAVIVVAEDEYYRHNGPKQAFKEFLSKLPFADLDLGRIHGNYREASSARDDQTPR